jgi:hypothetical protein
MVFLFLQNSNKKKKYNKRYHKTLMLLGLIQFFLGVFVTAMCFVPGKSYSHTQLFINLLLEDEWMNPQVQAQVKPMTHQVQHMFLDQWQFSVQLDTLKKHWQHLLGCCCYCSLIMQTILKIVTMLMIKGDLMANSGM